MWIEADIEYWDDRVLTFDPEKVLGRLVKVFPQIEIDMTDYSLDELDRVTAFAKENLPEPDHTRMINSIKRKNWTNGPTFKFQINIDDKASIAGHARRYSVAFRSESKIDNETEKKIIDFLKSLEYGTIQSNTQSNYFTEPDDEHKDYWLLTESFKNNSR